MRKNLTSFFLRALILTTITTFAEKEGANFHKPISWKPPSQGTDFENWEFLESSLMYENKIILTPTGIG